METVLYKDTIEDIEKAAKVIAGGGLIAFPTETVYGLGADALNEEACRNIYAAKGRPSDNPMIVHIAKIEDMDELSMIITDDMRALADNFWPGPLTMICPRKPAIPDVTTGGLDTVGIRMPSNEVARALIEKAGCSIAAPSANLSGKPSPTTAQHCIDDLTGKIDGIIVSDDCSVGIESTVIDMTGEVPMILRPGYITKADLERVLGKTVVLDPTLNKKPDSLDDGDFKPKAPGMKYKHYAPEAQMTIYSGPKDKVLAEIAAQAEKLELDGLKVAKLLFDDADSAARELFARLRQADKEGADVILAAALDEDGLGFSVMNRMFKSAGFNVVNL